MQRQILQVIILFTYIFLFLLVETEKIIINQNGEFLQLYLDLLIDNKPNLPLPSLQ